MEKSSTPLYKKWWFYLIIFLIFVFIVNGIFGKPKTVIHEGQSKIPAKNSELKGKKYKEVQSLFEKAGFKNIKLKKVDNLILGVMHKKGDVKEVLVDDKKDYKKGDWYNWDVEIVIKYFTYVGDDEITSEVTSEEIESSDKKEEEELSDNIEKENESVIEEETTNNDEVETENVESTTKESVNESTTESITTTEKIPDVLTVNNNEDFNTLMHSEYPDGDTIKRFANKYAGKTVVYKGYVAYFEGEYALIYFGNSTGSNDPNDYIFFMGPVIRVRVDTTNLYIGENVKVKAKVLNYVENSNLLNLRAIRIVER